VEQRENIKSSWREREREREREIWIAGSETVAGERLPQGEKGRIRTTKSNSVFC
jgi:dihydrofolate reductase